MAHPAATAGGDNIILSQAEYKEVDTQAQQPVA